MKTVRRKTSKSTQNEELKTRARELAEKEVEWREALRLEQSEMMRLTGEVDAVNDCVEALGGLEASAQIRVLGAVIILLDLSVKMQHETR